MGKRVKRHSNGISSDCLPRDGGVEFIMNSVCLGVLLLKIWIYLYL